MMRGTSSLIARWISAICCPMTESTSMWTILLNSSKHAQAPQAQALKNLPLAI